MKEFDLEKENTTKLYFSYAIPSMIGVAVFSLYSLVDTVFVSKYCGAYALSAIEICSPMLAVFSCISVMVGTGANALIGISFGKKQDEKASELFSLSSSIIAVLGVIFLLILLFLNKEVAVLLGSDNSTNTYACDYLKICGAFAPFILLSSFWLMLMEIVGKPYITLIGNLIMAGGNILLDYIFVVKMNMGVLGAGLASSISSLLAFLLCLFVLLATNCKLHFVRFKFDIKSIKQILYNGLSEGLSTIGVGVTSFIYNIVIMKVSGSIALSSFSITLTIISFAGSMLIGASQSIGSIVSVNYGARKYNRIKQTMKTAMVFGLVLSLIIVAAFSVLHSNIIDLFDAENSQLTWQISKAYIPVLILTPLNICIISYFTAVNNAKISANLSILRTFIIRITVVIIAYLLFGINGVWYSAAISEFVSFIIEILYYKKSINIGI